MQDITITLVQASQVWEDKQANFDNYLSLMNGHETDLFLLPEMFQTSFSMNTTELAEPFNNSPSIDWLQRMSREKNAAIYTSLIIEEDGKYYNRAVFITPNGDVHHYDKRKTFGLAKEDQHFTSGNSEKIVNYLGWKFQLQVCYDLRFPEIARNRILSNQKAAYDVLLYVANWPEKRSRHWKKLLAARAIENQCFVVGLNRVGEDQKGLCYSGDSMLVDALGNESTLKINTEEVQSFSLKMNELMQTRELLPFLKDA